MGDKVIYALAFLVILIENGNGYTVGDHLEPIQPTETTMLSPLETSRFDESIRNRSNHNKNFTEVLSRVKRQYSYGRRDRLPIPIIVGGFGYPAFGPRGYGGRGYGGRGYGGRGYGGRGSVGRGFGGRGIGGRGIGGRGIGGRGGIGGGRGGRG